ncbi:MAG: lipoyl synthase [Thermoplasmata archaeon]
MASALIPTGSRPEAPGRLPEWIRVRPPREHYTEVRDLLSELKLGTVCREAHCPNLSECWSAGTATLMLLGTDCTRRCGFCAVRTHWPGGVVDSTEPARVGEAVRRWGLRYVVLTQVCRDDLVDGGAEVLAETVREIRLQAPATRVELLIGDLQGRLASIRRLLEDPPDVLAHNLETVRSLSAQVRDRRAGYDQSLGVLRTARDLGGPRLVTKSSIMLGLGETESMLDQSFHDLREAGVDLLTVGQYLRPSAQHVPISAFVLPDTFDRLRRRALEIGFQGVEAGPLVRSSYHAEELFTQAYASRGG